MLQRLLPDAYRDDSDDSAEFRRFTERSLTSAKVANAEAVLASLAGGRARRDIDDDDVEDQDPIEVELDPDAVQAWLRTLTDIRLSLAVRLGIETDEDAMLLHQSDGRGGHGHGRALRLARLRAGDAGPALTRRLTR